MFLLGVVLSRVINSIMMWKKKQLKIVTTPVKIFWLYLEVDSRTDAIMHGNIHFYYIWRRWSISNNLLIEVDASDNIGQCVIVLKLLLQDIALVAELSVLGKAVMGKRDGCTGWTVYLLTCSEPAGLSLSGPRVCAIEPRNQRPYITLSSDFIFIDTNRSEVLLMFILASFCQLSYNKNGMKKMPKFCNVSVIRCQAPPILP